MANTELTLDQLKGINGGFLLVFLLGGCADKKDDQKNDKKNDKKTWVDIGSAAAICKSGSSHENPLHPDANCPDNSSQK